MGGQLPTPVVLPPRKRPLPLAPVQEAGWDLGLVWTCMENLIPTGVRTPVLPTRSECQCRLSYIFLQVFVRIWCLELTTVYPLLYLILQPTKQYTIHSCLVCVFLIYIHNLLYNIIEVNWITYFKFYYFFVRNFLPLMYSVLFNHQLSKNTNKMLISICLYVPLFEWSSVRREAQWFSKFIIKTKVLHIYIYVYTHTHTHRWLMLVTLAVDFL